MGGKAIGVAQTVDAVADPAAYTAHAAGATTVTSNAATDLDTTAAQVAVLTTTVQSMLTALREHGLMES